MFGDPVRNEKGWERYKLNDLSKKITDGEHQNPKITQSGKYLIMGQDVKDDYIDFSRNIFISKQDFEKFTKKCKPERDDILLISRGATIGRCTKIEIDIPFALMGSVILIKPKEKEYSDYLNYLIKNPHFSRHVINLSSASAQQAIYLTHLKKMLIPFPPIQKQIEFSNKIKNIKLQKNKTQHSFQKSEELFNSLLQKAFKGELVE
jgi:type I restriction enzyme S subunit